MKECRTTDHYKRLIVSRSDLHALELIDDHAGKSSEPTGRNPMMQRAVVEP